MANQLHKNITDTDLHAVERQHPSNPNGSLTGIVGQYAQDTSTGDVYRCTGGTGWQKIIDVSVSTGGAAGSNTQVQYNDAGSTAGATGLVYNKATSTTTAINLSVTGSTTIGDAPSDSFTAKAKQLTIASGISQESDRARIVLTTYDDNAIDGADITIITPITGDDQTITLPPATGTLSYFTATGTNNEIITSGGDYGLVSESNLTFDGSTLAVTGAITANTLNTGQGANELYAMDQNVRTTDAVTFATVNTGQGANELYAMDQNVRTTDGVTFATVNTGHGANELYPMDQAVRTTDTPTFGRLTLTQATGTAPLTISSTTVVSNLNADLWDGYQFADYLNQAVKTTSSPSFYGMTIGQGTVGSQSSQINLKTYDTADAITVNFILKSPTGASTLGQDRTLTLPDATGILAYWASGNTNNRVLTSDGASGLVGEANLTFDGTTLIAPYFQGDGSGLTNVSATATPAGSDGQVQYNNSGALGGASALYYDDTNSRVGIGTGASVTNKLTILNGVDEPTIIRINGVDATTEFGALGIQSGEFVITAGGTGSTNTDLVLRTALSGTETERMRITSGGIVSIGQGTSTSQSSQINLKTYDNDLGTTVNFILKSPSGIITTGADRTLTLPNETGTLLTTTGNGSGLTNVNATTLDGLDSLQFLRSDTSDTFTGTLTMSGSINFGSSNGDIDLSRGSYITFYEDGSTNHAIGSRDNAGNEADDIRLNSYGAVYINLDSNNNNTSGANFQIGRHGGVGTISDWLLTLDGETGNLGIGTASPANKLSIQGSVVNASIVNTTTGTDASPSFSGLRFYGYQEVQNGWVAAIEGGNSQSNSYRGALRFLTRANVASTDPTERMRIDSSGNVGIGTTSPNAPLEIAAGGTNGTLSVGRVSGYPNIKASTDGSGHLMMDSRSNYASINHYVSYNVLLAFGGGSVGIGTASPNAKIDVRGSAIFNEDGGNNDFRVESDTDQYALFMDASASCVGISTGAPNASYSFHVGGGNALIENNLDVVGTLSKGGGSFRIPHPDPAKPTMELWHSFTESPTAGENLYRWQVEVKDGIGTILLPDYYKHLNENDQVWVSPYKHFGQAWGEVTEDQEYLIIHANEDGLYNVLLIGTRKDEIAKKAWKGAEREGNLDYIKAAKNYNSKQQ